MNTFDNRSSCRSPDPGPAVGMIGSSDAPPPSHDARALTAGGALARIVLDGATYQLRITRAGRLILTK